MVADRARHVNHPPRLFAWRGGDFARKLGGPETIPDSKLNPTVANASSPPPPTVHAVAGWRRALLWPLALLVRWWGRTLRFEISPEDERNVRKNDEPVAFVVWHNRLFLVSEVYRRYRGGRELYALISASKDGALLAAFFEMVGGMRAVRGSSSRLGREAASALIEQQRAGNDIGITPDGPRGPCYDFKAGAVIVPRRTGAPLLLLGGEFDSAWQLKSWDRFYLPRPFSKVRIRCQLVPNATLADRDGAVATIRERMLAINPDRAAVS